MTHSARSTKADAPETLSDTVAAAPAAAAPARDKPHPAGIMDPGGVGAVPPPPGLGGGGPPPADRTPAPAARRGAG